MDEVIPTLEIVAAGVDIYRGNPYYVSQHSATIEGGATVQWKEGTLREDEDEPDSPSSIPWGGEDPVVVTWKEYDYGSISIVWNVEGREEDIEGDNFTITMEYEPLEAIDYADVITQAAEQTDEPQENEGFHPLIGGAGESIEDILARDERHTDFEFLATGIETVTTHVKIYSPVYDEQFGAYRWSLTYDSTTDPNEQKEENKYNISWHTRLPICLRPTPGRFIDGIDWDSKRGTAITDPYGLSAIWTYCWSTHMNRICHWYTQNSWLSYAVDQEEYELFTSQDKQGIQRRNTYLSNLFHPDWANDSALLQMINNKIANCRVTIKKTGDPVTAEWFNNCAYMTNNYTECSNEYGEISISHEKFQNNTPATARITPISASLIKKIRDYNDRP